MKILICTESYYPNISGVAVFSHNLAIEMVKKNHQVFVIAPSPKFSEFTEIVDNVTIYRLKSRVNKFREGYFISRSPFKKVPEIIDKLNPDVIHLQDPAMISLAALRKARKLKIPVIVTNHFSLEYIVSYLPKLKIFHSLILFFMTHYLNWFYNQCQVLTCPTQTVAKRFKGPITKVELQVISNGVDLSRFIPYYGNSDSIRKRWKIPLLKPVILFVGRLDIDKNISLLIQAIPLILNQVDAHLVLVGSGKEKNNLIKLVKKLNITQSATFIDFIPYKEQWLPRIYQTAQIFINPCPMETQSIVALEAQATGLPLVVANSGALKELVKEGVNGYKFDPKNEKDLAEKIIKILTNKKLAQKMGEKSIEMVEGHLVENTHDRFEKIYQKLAKV